MPSSDTQFKAGNKGRPKGARNKRTVRVEDALQEAFDKLGGVPALVKFGKQDPEEFYKLWVKMLPQQVKTDVTHHGDLREMLLEGRRRLQEDDK